MSDKELADRVVALLPDDYWSNNGGVSIMTPEGKVTCERFIRDWRVAGALMESIDDETLTWFQTGEKNWCVCELSFEGQEWVSESLPRAIIEACTAALEKT